MVYLLETELDDNIPVVMALTGVYGLGKSNSNVFCRKAGLSPNVTFNQLKVNQRALLLKCIEKSGLKLTSELKKATSIRNYKLVESKTYRGLRKLRGFPVRGQRTRTNAKTSRKFKKHTKF